MLKGMKIQNVSVEDVSAIGRAGKWNVEEIRDAVHASDTGCIMFTETGTTFTDVYTAVYNGDVTEHKALIATGHRNVRLLGIAPVMQMQHGTRVCGFRKMNESELAKYAPHLAVRKASNAEELKVKTAVKKK